MIEIPVMNRIQPKVKIGEETFNVRMSESDILERQCALYNSFTRLTTEAPKKGAKDAEQAQYAEKVIALKHEMLKLVDDVLGEGAFKAITGGGFVDDKTLAKITVMVREAAIEAIAEEVERVYE